MAPRLIVRTVSVLTLVFLLVPMGTAQSQSVGVYTGGLFAACDDPDGPVSWQGGQDSSPQGACPDTQTLEGASTTLRCVVNELGNEVCLVATSQGLECSWNVGVPPDTSFVTTYFVAGCKVSGGGASFDAHSLNAGNQGSVQVLEVVPTANLRWSAYVNAVEVEQYYSATNTYEKSLLAEWAVEGSYDTDLDLTVIGGGPAPVAWWAEGSVKTHLGWSIAVSAWQRMFTSEEIQVRERQAGMVGANNLLVSTAPAVDEIRWSGKLWGCDWLNVIEELHRPREISGYSTFMKTTAADSGEHEVDLQGSLLAKLIDRGSYEAVLEGSNGFTATFSNAANFQSTIQFDVDYDQEWLTNTAYIDVGDEAQDASTAGLQVDLSDAPGGVLVQLVKAEGVSPWDIATPVAFLGAAELSGASGLAVAIASALLVDDGLASGAQLRSDGGVCGSGTLESIHQNWSATGTVNGVGSTAAKSKLLDVEVFLDGFVQPDQ